MTGLRLSREEPREEAFDNGVKLRWLVQVFNHDPFDEGDAAVLELSVPGLVGGGAAAVVGPVHLDHADATAAGDDEVGPEGALGGAKPRAGQDPDRGFLGTALLGADQRLVYPQFADVVEPQPVSASMGSRNAVTAVASSPRHSGTRSTAR